MKILVCISNVPDTTTKIKFVDGKELDKTGVQWIINPWDELALTRALELKTANPSAIEKIFVAMVGKSDAEPTIRKALAMGADEAIRIDIEPKDSYTVASEISNAIKDMNFDIIMTGLESADFNGLSVGAMLGEFLNYQTINAVSGLDIENNQIKIKREIEGGYELIYTKTPLVAIVQKGIAITPLIANMRGIMQAKTKPLKVVTAANTDSLVDYISFELPKPKPPVKMVATAQELVSLLKNDAKLI